jgi:S-adenosylmethionine decarboxylase proenzyme
VGGGTETAEWWQHTLTSIFDDSPLLILHQHFHSFSPHGLTGYLLLSASHLSIHTWPEHRYLAIDLFSCLGEDLTRPMLDALLAQIPHERHELEILRRGYQPPAVEL